MSILLLLSVHEELREKTVTLGMQNAWENHCRDQVNLKKYAKAMRELATKHWECNIKAQPSVLSRIEWTYIQCKSYFTGDIYKFREKQKEIADKMKFKIAATSAYYTGKDCRQIEIAGCRKLDCLEVIAIDIAPGSDDVLKCDFLNVNAGNSLKVSNTEVQALPQNYFDVIVFSLLLEYLPYAKQRLTCCKKAYSLLKTEGLLVIVTPDSNRVGANAKYIKSWRFILADLGFSRVKYEKLPHIHCMAFRKEFCTDVARRWAELYRKNQVYSEMVIPQDFKSPDISKPEKNEHEQYTFEYVDEFPDCDEEANKLRELLRTKPEKVKKDPKTRRESRHERRDCVLF
ncbi:hypothetical protein NQ317_017914 [Molorchus minor]|uniref:S-adenosylmethionine sensor upstream of mTORC1 n=1 Tax=Molorchus minor TaxID=1323400 RepID=A0ABQ9ISE2_9CUCU|nr:hypothetical protein NQ317_017914 [Molorchus minor]